MSIRITRTHDPFFERLDLMRWLGAALVAGILGWIVYTILTAPDEPAGRPRSTNANANIFFAGTPPGLVDEIKITPPARDEIHFVRKQGAWLVEVAGRWRHLDAARAAGLFDDPRGEPEIRQDAQAFVQSETPLDSTGSFGVYDGRGVRVQFLANGALVEEMLVGNRATRGGAISTFVGHPPSTAVYILDGDLVDNFAGAGARDWREARMFPAREADDIAAIRVTDPEQARSFALVRDAKDGWTLEANGTKSPARAERARLAAEELAALRAQDFIPATDGAAMLVASPVTRIEIEVRGSDKPQVLEVGGETTPGGGLYLAHVLDTDDYVAIFRLFAVMRDPSELR